MTDDPEDALESQPPLGEAFDMTWPDGYSTEEKIESVAVTVREPKTAEWIAKRANVDLETTLEILNEWVRGDKLIVRLEDDGDESVTFLPNPYRDRDRGGD